MFKITGLIKDDEDFDTFHLESMSRRRFSSDFFLEIAQESKQTKEYIEAVKKQEYIYHITYLEDEQKIENFTKFSKIVLMVIHCIREKVKDAQNIRDEEFERRSGTLQNDLDRSLPASESDDENDDDEISLDRFQKKVGGNMKKKVGGNILAFIIIGTFFILKMSIFTNL